MFASIQRKEPYVSWKNTSKLVTVPSWSRPIQSSSLQLGNTLRARPMKHWRKQLIPEANSGSGVSSIKIQDTPTSSIENSAICNSLGKPITRGIVGTFEINNNLVSCDDTCNPEKNVIKSSLTSVNDNSHISTTSYMKSRCMLYNQKLSVTPIEGNVYFNQDISGIVWSSNDPKGSQCRKTIDCSEKCNVAIYKPNNDQFANQGSINSSARIYRLKYNTIYGNGSSLNTAWGAVAVNSGKFITFTNGPYNDKYKLQPCVNR